VYIKAFAKFHETFIFVSSFTVAMFPSKLLHNFKIVAVITPTQTMIENVAKQIGDLIVKAIDVYSFSIKGIKLDNSLENIPLSEIIEMSLSSHKDEKFIEKASLPICIR
jgi:hypothetical protein